MVREANSQSKADSSSNGTKRRSLGYASASSTLGPAGHPVSQPAILGQLSLTLTFYIKKTSQTASEGHVTFFFFFLGFIL
jgi:hypothetical protein